jgi:hypothetical protein
MNIKNDTERFVKKIPIKTYTEKDETVRKMIYEAFEKSKQTKLVFVQPNIWRIILGSKAGSLVATFLIISSLVACFVLYKEVKDLRNELSQRDVAIAPTQDSVTINFYLREHQDAIAQYASLNSATPQSVQMHINQDDILYYEFLGNRPEFTRPGIIVRGPLSQHQIGSPEAPMILNGHTLTLSEAEEATNFDLSAPQMLHPCYMLDQIRMIEDSDTLQLLYTNGINSVSLFEQSLDGELGLSSKDFREYAIYRNEGKAGGTILAWRDDTLSYVLIGSIEMSQLMDLAQSISIRNERE